MLRSYKKPNKLLIVADVIVAVVATAVLVACAATMGTSSEEDTSSGGNDGPRLSVSASEHLGYLDYRLDSDSEFFDAGTLIGNRESISQHLLEQQELEGKEEIFEEESFQSVEEEIIEESEDEEEIILEDNSLEVEEAEEEPSIIPEDKELQVEEVVPEPEPAQESEVSEPVTVSYPWTDEEVTMLAQLVWAEAGGVSNKSHQAAVIWCVLNRVDDSRFGNTIKSVVTAKGQFAYRSSTPVKQSMIDLVEDVLMRWYREKQGETNVGRTLPKNYFYFTGNGSDNRFRKEFNSTSYWDWSLPSPY